MKLRNELNAVPSHLVNCNLGKTPTWGTKVEKMESQIGSSLTAKFLGNKQQNRIARFAAFEWLNRFRIKTGMKLLPALWSLLLLTGLFVVSPGVNNKAMAVSNVEVHWFNQGGVMMQGRDIYSNFGNLSPLYNYMEPNGNAWRFGYVAITTSAFHSDFRPTIRETGLNGNTHSVARLFNRTNAGTHIGNSPYPHHPMNGNNRQPIRVYKDTTSTFGEWFLSEKWYIYGPPTDTGVNKHRDCPTGKRCWFFAFKPDLNDSTDAINRLNIGQAIALTFGGDKSIHPTQAGIKEQATSGGHFGANVGFSASATLTLRSPISLKWEDKDGPLRIETGPHSVDRLATVEVLPHPNKPSIYPNGFRESREWVGPSTTPENQRTGWIRAMAGDANPDGTLATNLFGSGHGTVHGYGRDYRLGTWYYAENLGKVKFRPKASGYNNMAPGDIGTTYLNLNRGATVGSLTYTIRRPKVTLGISRIGTSGSNLPFNHHTTSPTPNLYDLQVRFDQIVGNFNYELKVEKFCGDVNIVKNRFNNSTTITDETGYQKFTIAHSTASNGDSTFYQITGNGKIRVTILGSDKVIPETGRTEVIQSFGTPACPEATFRNNFRGKLKRIGDTLTVEINRPDQEIDNIKYTVTSSDANKVSVGSTGERTLNFTGSDTFASFDLIPRNVGTTAESQLRGDGTAIVTIQLIAGEEYGIPSGADSRLQIIVNARLPVIGFDQHTFNGDEVTLPISWANPTIDNIAFTARVSRYCGDIDSVRFRNFSDLGGNEGIYVSRSNAQTAFKNFDEKFSLTGTGIATIVVNSTTTYFIDLARSRAVLRKDPLNCAMASVSSPLASPLGDGATEGQHIEFTVHLPEDRTDTGLHFVNVLISSSDPKVKVRNFLTNEDETSFEADVAFKVEESSKTIKVPIIGDVSDTDNVEITVKLRDGIDQGRYYSLNPDAHTIKIKVKDNDTASVSESNPLVSLSYVDTTPYAIVVGYPGTFSVTADSGTGNNPLPENLVVNLRATAATVGFDVAGNYIEPGEEFDFTVNVDATSKARTFNVLARDYNIAGNLTVELLDGAGYVRKDGTASNSKFIRLIPPAELGIAVSSAHHNTVNPTVEEGATATFIVKILEDSLQTTTLVRFTVDWVVSLDNGATAVRGDFVGSSSDPTEAVRSGTLTFNPHSSQRSFSVNLEENSINQPDRNFFVTLTNLRQPGQTTVPRGVRIRPGAFAEMTIEDDDRIVINPLPAIEDELVVKFDVKLTTLIPTAGNTVNFNWAVSKETGDTADLADFCDTSSPVGAYPSGTGQISGDSARRDGVMISVEICADAVNEENETFTFTISSVTGTDGLTALPGAPSSIAATGTILNDDLELEISSDAGSDGVALGDSFTLTVTATPPPVEPLDVNLSLRVLDESSTAHGVLDESSAEARGKLIASRLISSTSPAFFGTSVMDGTVTIPTTGSTTLQVNTNKILTFENHKFTATLLDSHLLDALDDVDGSDQTTDPLTTPLPDPLPALTLPDPLHESVIDELAEGQLPLTDSVETIVLTVPSQSLPRLSILAPSNNVAAGTNARFAIQAYAGRDTTVDPVPVKYQLSGSGSGNFIAPWEKLAREDGTAVNDTVRLTSNATNRDGQIVTYLDIATTDPDSSTDDAHGTITVTLVDGDGYTLAESPDHIATATISDDVIVVNIRRSGTETDPDMIGLPENHVGTFDFEVTLSKSSTRNVNVSWQVYRHIVALPNDLDSRDYSNLSRYQDDAYACIFGDTKVREWVPFPLYRYLYLCPRTINWINENTGRPVPHSENASPQWLNGLHGFWYANEFVPAGYNSGRVDNTDFNNDRLASGRIQFTNGRTTDTIQINVKNDSIPETNEVFFVVLSNPWYFGSSTLDSETITDGSLVLGNSIAAHRILDDDGPTLSVAPLANAVAEGNTGVTNFPFQLTLSQAAVRPFNVWWKVAGSGSNAASADDFYVERVVDGNTIERDVRFPTGKVRFELTESNGTRTATTATLLVPINGDMVGGEGNEGFTVTLVSPSGGEVVLATDPTASGTITNDEGQRLPVLSIADATTVTEGASTTSVSFNVTARGSSSSPGTLTVAYTATNEVGDFLTSGSGLTTTMDLPFTTSGSNFAATLPIRITNNDVDESTGRISVKLEGGSGYQVDPDASDNTAHVLIYDDESVQLTIGTPSTATVTETDPTTVDTDPDTYDYEEAEIMFPLTASRSNFSGSVYVNYTVADCVPGLAKCLPDESDGDNYKGVLRGDYVDERPRHLIDGNFVHPVWLNGFHTKQVTFTNGAAMLPITYINDDSFDADGKVRVTLVEYQPDQRFYIHTARYDGGIDITNPKPSELPALYPYTLPSGNTGRFAEVSMVDDDGMVLRMTDMEVREGNADSVLTFRVELLNSALTSVNAPAGGINFTWRTVDGTAVASEDFVGVTAPATYTANAAGTGTIGVGQPHTDITVTLKGDTIKESHETFRVELVEVTTGDDISLEGAHSTVTVMDNDVSISLSTDATTIDEGGDFTITLEAEPVPTDANPIEITSLTASGFAATFSGGDSEATKVTIGSSGTAEVTVSTDDDGLYSDGGTLTVTLGDADDYFPHAINNSVSVTVTEAESEVPEITLARVGSGIVAEGGTFEVSLTADPKPGGDYKVIINTLDFDATGYPVTFSAGTTTTPLEIGTSGVGTVTVTVTDDDTDTSSKQFAKVTLTDGTDYTAITTGLPLNVEVDDDERPPYISLTRTESGSVNEGGTFTVQLTAERLPNSGMVEITTLTTGALTGLSDAVIGGTFSSGDSDANKLTITSTNPVDVTVMVTEDTDYASDGTLAVILGSGNATYLPDPENNRVNVSIVDNEAVPVLRISDAPLTPAGSTAVFAITSSVHPLGDIIRVHYKPFERRGNFLEETAGRSGITRDVDLTFTRGTTPDNPSTASLVVRTENDTNSTSGRIAVTLLDDSVPSSARKDYTISAIAAENEAIANISPPTVLSVTSDYSFVTNGFGNNLEVTVSRTSSIGELEFHYHWTDNLAGRGSNESVISEVDKLTPRSMRFVDGETEKLVKYVMGFAQPAANRHEVEFVLRSGNYEIDDERGKFVFDVEAFYPSDPNDPNVRVPVPNIRITGPDAVSEGSSATFTVTLVDSSGMPTSPLSRTYGTAPNDVTLNNAAVNIRITQGTGQNIIAGLPTTPLTIDSMEGTQFTVQTLNDGNAGGSDGMITAQLLPGSGYVLYSDIHQQTLLHHLTHTVTVKDNAGKATVDFTSDASVSVSEGDGNLELDVELSEAAQNVVTIPFTITAGTATAGEDYTVPNPASITIAAGVTAGKILIPIIDDRDIETLTAEMFTVTLGTPTGAVNGSTLQTITVTINENDSDTPTVTFAAESINPVVKEALPLAGSTQAINHVELWVELSNRPTQVLEVKYALTDGTATLNEDYKKTRDLVQFLDLTSPDRPYRIRFTVDILQDLIEERGPETFTVTLSISTGTPNAGILGDMDKITSTVTIIDTTGPPKLGFLVADDDPATTDDVSVAENVTGGSATVDVALSHATFRRVSYSYSITGGTATSGEDFVDNSGTPISIAAGETTSSITIPITNDSVFEPDEDFTVTLSSSPTNATLTETAANLTRTVTITEDDTEPTVEFESATYRVAENAETIMLKIVMSNVSHQAVTIPWSTADGTATEPGDYTEVASGSETIAAGSTETTVSITIISDTDATEIAENFTVTLGSSPTNATLKSQGNTTATVTIVEATDEPILSFKTGSGTASRTEDAGALTFTVELDMAHTSVMDDITVQYRIEDIEAVGGTATATGVDYTFTSRTGTLTFDQNPPGGSAEIAKNITITIEDDSIDESAEKFRIVLFNPQHAILSGGVATLTSIQTITDNDDEPVITIQQTGSIAEGVNPGIIQLAVNLTRASASPVTVKYSVTAVTASASDYSDPGGGEITIQPGGAIGAIRIAIVDDDDYEEDETFTVQILSTSINATPHATTSFVTSTVTITPDANDVRPTVGLTNATVSVAEGVTGGMVSVPLTFSASTHETVRVAYTVTGVTASSTGDFTDANSGTIDIAPSATKAIPITITDDMNFEQNETFTVQLTGVTHLATPEVEGSIEGEVLTTVTITPDSDAAPTFQFQTGSDMDTVAEGSNAKTELTVELSATTYENVTISYTITPVAATSGNSSLTSADYTDTTNGTVSIAAGSTTGKIEIGIVDDDDFETNEQFTVALSTAAPSAYTSSGTTMSTVTVTSADDTRPTVAFKTDSPYGVDGMGNATVSFDEGDTDHTQMLTVELSATTYETVVVTFAAAADTAMTPDDFTVAGTTVTIMPGETTGAISADIVANDALNPNKTFSVTLGSVTHGGTAQAADKIGTPAKLIVTIADDDPLPTAEFAATSRTASVAEGGTVTLTVNYAGGDNSAVTVNYTIAPVDLSLLPSEYVDATSSTTDGVVMLNNGTGTITINIVDDANVERDEDFTVTLAGTAEVTVGTNNVATVTILADARDAKPSVSFAAATQTVQEDVGTANLSVVLTATTFNTVTVNYSLAAGTATLTTDFADSSTGSITVDFDANGNSTTGTIPITIVQDTDFEPSETFTVTISSVSDATAQLGSSLTTTVTIADDDNVPTVSFKSTTATVAEADGAMVGVTAILSHISYEAVKVDYVILTREDDTDPNNPLNLSASTIDVVTAKTGGSVNIPAGTTEFPFNIAVANDTVFEEDETFQVQIAPLTAAANNATNDSDDQAVTVTITPDADVAPEIRFTDVTATTTEGDRLQFHLGISYSVESDVTAKVGYEIITTNNPNAPDIVTASNADVSSTANTHAGSQDINPGAARRLTFITLQDSNYEGNETFQVKLATITAAANNATNASSNQTITVTINDDDSAPTAYFTNTSLNQTVTEDDNTEVGLTVELSATSFADVTVNYEVVTAENAPPSNSDITAKINDITSTATSIVIRAGGTTGRIAIGINNDQHYEIAEKFQVRITSLEGGTKTDTNQTSTVTINPDATDTQPRVEFIFKSEEQLKQSEGNSITLEVELSHESYETVTVNYETRDRDYPSIPDTITAVNADLQPGTTTGSVAIAPSELKGSFTVGFAVDTVTEAEETVRIVLVSPENATLGSRNEIDVTIVDGSQTPTVFFATSHTRANATEGEQVQLDVQLSFNFRQAIEVVYEVILDGTPTINTDFTDANYTGMENSRPRGRITIPARQPSGAITFNTLRDGIFEGNEQFTVNIVSANIAGSAGESVAVASPRVADATILDFEDAPVLSLAGSYASGLEGNSGSRNMVVRVNMSHVSTVETIFFVSTGAVPSSIDVESATDRVDYTPLNRMRVRIAPRTRFVEFNVVIIGDTVAEPDEAFYLTLTLDDPNISQFAGNESVLNSLAWILNDDMVETPEVEISGERPGRITEGETAVFIITATPPPRNGAITVGVETVVEGDFVLFRVPRIQFFELDEVSANRSMKRIEIATRINHASQDDGSITMTVLAGTGYDLVPGNESDRITVANSSSPSGRAYSIAAIALENILGQAPIISSSPPVSHQAPPQGQVRSVSIAPASPVVAEGADAVFEIRAAVSGESELTIRINLTGSVSKINGDLSRTTVLAAGQTEATLTVETVDDGIAGRDGSITAKVENQPGVVVSPNTATVTISDAADREVRGGYVAAANREVLANMMANVGAGSLYVTTERMTTAFSGEIQSSYKFGGLDSFGGLVRTAGESMNGITPELATLIGNSSVTINLYPEEGVDVPATIWAVGDHDKYSGGTGASGKSWNAESTSGFVGFDLRIDDGVLLGVSTSVYATDVLYDSNADDGLKYDISSTGLHPYIGFESGDRSTILRTSAGYGFSEIAIEQASHQTETLHGVHYTTTVSGSQQLYVTEGIPGGRSELGLTGESWYARQIVESIDGRLPELQVDAGHVSVAAVGSHSHQVSFGIVEPSVSIGMRRDVKNRYSTLGLELGNGLDYRNGQGLSISGTGEMFFGEGDRIRSWNLSGDVKFDRNEDRSGLLVSFSPSWHQIRSTGQDSIWTGGLANLGGQSQVTGEGRRFDSELGYGFAVIDGSAILTPFGGLNYQEFGQNEVRMGSRFSLGSALDLELKNTQSHQSGEYTDRKIDLTGRLSW